MKKIFVVALLGFSLTACHHAPVGSMGNAFEKVGSVKEQSCVFTDGSRHWTRHDNTMEKACIKAKRSCVGWQNKFAHQPETCVQQR